MTYVPPERDEPELDQTRQLDVSPAPAATDLPATGDGAPIDPFAGQAPEVVGYREQPVRRDRVVFQFVWEGILLLLTLNVLFLVYRREGDLFGDEFGGLMDALDRHALYLAPILLAALAIGMSLRLGAVNLAVPAVAYAVTVAMPFEANVWIHLGYMAAAAAVAGLLYVLLVAAFRVPAWFAGLAVGVVVLAAVPVTFHLADPGDYTLPAPPNGLFVLGGAAVLAIAGGLIGLAPGVRDAFSAVKRLTDGEERTASSVFLLLGGTILSMLLAAGSGFLVYAYAIGPIEGEHSLNFGPYGTFPLAIELQLMAFVIVLLAGTSLWGRRGGILGAVLATIAVWAGLVLWNDAAIAAGEDSWQAAYSPVIDAGFLLVALFVSFALDRLGRPKETTDTAETQELRPFEPAESDSGTGLFEPTLPDPAPAQR